MTAEESKIWKAKNLRYKKPIVRDLNFDRIREDLWEIGDACEEVRWYVDSDDGADTLLNALAGDEDEAYEFKMAFADLSAECDRMWDDLQNEWVPNCFDAFFVSVGAGTYYGGLLGFDSYEEDYYGLGSYEEYLAENEASKKLYQMRKKDLIAAARRCFRIYHAYIGLRYRYDNLKAALDILRDQNTGVLQVVREIDRLYDALEGAWSDYGKEARAWKQYTDALPPEAWLQ